DFFQLGGDSLKATILISKIHKKLHVKIPLTQLFTTPTVEGLSRYIKDADEDKYVSIRGAEEKEYYALSSAQKRMYFLQQIEPENKAYNISKIIFLSEPPEPGELKKTFEKLIKRHESLRTAFEIVDNEPVQKIYDDVKFEVEYYEPPEQTRESAENGKLTVEKNIAAAFDLSKAPLLRVRLIKEGENRYILFIEMHHIIADGTSLSILQEEFAVLYRGQELEPLRIQYKDYAEWQYRFNRSGELEKQEEFWLKLFEKKIPLLNLPIDYPRPELQSFEGDRIGFRIGSKETATLKALALKEETTFYMVILALFNVLLSKITGMEDIVIGSTIAGRGHADLEKIIGMFINTLPLRNYPGSEKTFARFLADVKKQTLEAFENQDYQFEDLVEKLAVKRLPGRNPIFDILFSFLNMAPDTESASVGPTADPKGKSAESKPGDSGEQQEYGIKTAKFDLKLSGMEENGELSLEFEYATRLFKKETIQRFIEYFRKISARVIENYNEKIGNIETLSSEERNRLLMKIRDEKDKKFIDEVDVNQDNPYDDEADFDF
ncbi:MAG: non-ribosomal peptide synthetase, partial [bacterium]|nr:non-ribosomal peptide synthetase [bacterium]